MKRQNPQAQQLKNAKLTKDFELWSQDMLNAKDADWVIDGSYFMEVNLKKSSADYATQAQVAAALIQLINNTLDTSRRGREIKSQPACVDLLAKLREYKEALEEHIIVPTKDSLTISGPELPPIVRSKDRNTSLPVSVIPGPVSDDDSRGIKSEGRGRGISLPVLGTMRYDNHLDLQGSFPPPLPPRAPSRPKVDNNHLSTSRGALFTAANETSRENVLSSALREAVRRKDGSVDGQKILAAVRIIESGKMSVENLSEFIFIYNTSDKFKQVITSHIENIGDILQKKDGKALKAAIQHANQPDAIDLDNKPGK